MLSQTCNDLPCPAHLCPSSCDVHAIGVERGLDEMDILKTSKKCAGLSVLFQARKKTYV